MPEVEVSTREEGFKEKNGTMGELGRKRGMGNDVPSCLLQLVCLPVIKTSGMVEPATATRMESSSVSQLRLAMNMRL